MAMRLPSDPKESVPYLRGYYDAKADYEVKHGRWVSIGNTVMAKCSCGFFTDKWKTYHYCPNCGAKMDEECENESR